LCGVADADFVEADYFSSACGALEANGFPLEPSELNLASIAIESLAETQTVRRYVNNVSDSVAFTATVEAPAGVDVMVSVLDWNTSTFVDSITWSDGAHNVRSPIVLKPTLPLDIPEALSIELQALQQELPFLLKLLRTVVSLLKALALHSLMFRLAKWRSMLIALLHLMKPV
jgi:hypothetical protein